MVVRSVTRTVKATWKITIMESFIFITRYLLYVYMGEWIDIDMWHIKRVCYAL